MRVSRFLFCLLLVASTGSWGCGLFRPATPTNVFSDFCRAVKADDLAGMKNNVSADSVALGEQIARMQDRSLDDLIRENDGERSGLGETRPETGEERIDGETATLQVRLEPSKGWITLPFVKERGRWKIAFDKQLQNLKTYAE